MKNKDLDKACEKAWSEVWYDSMIHSEGGPAHNKMSFYSGFSKGVELERSRSKKLLESLKYLLRAENDFGQFRKFQGEIVLSPSEIELAEGIIKAYEEN